MRQNRFLYYLVFQFLTVPMVIAIFKNSTDKKLASLLAASLFLAVCLGSFWWEHRKAQFQSKVFWITGLQFFILFVVPILFLRLVFWEQNFMEIEFLGIRPSELHRYSNQSFLVWSAGCVFEAVRFFLRNKKGAF